MCDPSGADRRRRRQGLPRIITSRHTLESTRPRRSAVSPRRGPSPVQSTHAKQNTRAVRTLKSVSRTRTGHRRLGASQALLALNTIRRAGHLKRASGVGAPGPRTINWHLQSVFTVTVSVSLRVCTCVCVCVYVSASLCLRVCKHVSMWLRPGRRGSEGARRLARPACAPLLDASPPRSTYCCHAESLGQTGRQPDASARRCARSLRRVGRPLIPLHIT